MVHDDRGRYRISRTHVAHFEDTCTSCWIETWEEAFVPLQPTYVIPGHGHPTNLAQVHRYTYEYLVDLREKVGAHLDDGGDLAGAYYVDQ